MLIPILVADHAVHPARVRRPGTRAARPRRPHRAKGRTASSGSSSRSTGCNRAVIQAINFGRTIEPTTCAPSTSPTTRKPATASAGRWERQVPGVPLVIVESPYRARHPAGRRLPRRARPGLAAGQRGADHHRRPARVRRPPLVGSVPLQPDREAPEGGLARTRAHGHRRRPVPAQAPTGSDGIGRRRSGRRGAAAVVSCVPCPTPKPRHFARAVVALNGGPSDARIVRLVAGQAARTKAELIAGPRGRDRLDPPARRGHRRALRGRPASARRRRGHRREPQATAGARAAPGARRRCGDRGRGDRARRRPARRGPSLSQAVRRRVRHRQDHPVHPAERAVRGLGRARADERGPS